jgi:serine/threonine protein kinase
VLAEVESLLRRGEPVDAQALLAAHPQLRGQKSAVLDLAYEEFCQRLEAGEAVDRDQFCTRFPQFQASLRRLLSAHCLMAENLERHPAVVSPADWPSPGQTFLGFQLLEELGRGTFGRVFLASEPALGGRLVAVKVSREGAIEAQTLGRLNHPHIVPVHSVVEEQATGLTVVCMPYLGRATLCDVLDRAFAPVPDEAGKEVRPQVPQRAEIILNAAHQATPDWQQIADWKGPAPVLRTGTYQDGVLHLAIQLADALAFIHGLGICHRDLKPSNVLLTPSGSAMLVDFNLSFDQQLADGRLGGTLPYMSPEQVLATDGQSQADPALCDGRSDLFSLGVILYELLTGLHPFGPIPLNLTVRQLRVQLLKSHRDGPHSLRQANPAVDSYLARLIKQCLAYNPNDRPASAAELGKALRRGLSPLRRGRRWLVQHARAVLAAGCLVLALGLAGSLYAGFIRESYDIRQLHQGQEAYRAGQYERAVQAFDAALEANPRQGDALWGRARAHQQLGVQYAEQAAVCPDPVEAGRLHHQQLRHLELAVSDYYNADPQGTDGRGLACLGYCQSHLRWHDQAVDCYRRAEAAGWATAAVYNDHAFTLLNERLSLDRLHEIRDLLDRAIAKDPNLAAARHNRALVEFRSALLDRHYVPQTGLEDIERALALEPATADRELDAARLYAVSGQNPEQVFAHLGRAVENGQNATGFEESPEFASLQRDPRFTALVQKAQGQKASTRAVRLIDPVLDQAD